MNIQSDLAKTTKSMLFQSPFYGHFLMGVNKSEVKGLKTAGVRKEGINIGLVVDPEWWMTLEEKYKVGVFIHEVKHIAFMHLTMRDSYLDKELFNIAAD